MTELTQALACPKTDVLATEAEISSGREVFHGIPIIETGEDADGLLAIGHFEPRRILAALHAYCRSRGLELEDIGVPDPAAPEVRTLVDRAARWTLFYRHADGETVEREWEEPDWCVCDEYSWWPLDVTKDAAGAVATMWWDLG